MKRVVIVICDGLWSGWLNSPVCAEIASIRQQSCLCKNHVGVVPTVTRVAAASLVTGCRPATHGLQGNKVALPGPDGLLTVHDVGKPEFITKLKEITGQTLLVPALSQLLREAGLFIGYSNVSPGAAYFLDPDHFGYVYHRAGSYGPGGMALSGAAGLSIQRGLVGDGEMTVRFCCDLVQREPLLSVLWLGEPDTSLHDAAPGTEGATAGIRCAAGCVSEVYRTVELLRAQGEDILFIVGSDHGMDTAKQVAFVESELVEAGLKASATDDRLVVATQGGGAAIYFKHCDSGLLEDLLALLRRKPWAGTLFAAHPDADGSLNDIGLSNRHGLTVFVNAAVTLEPATNSAAKLRWVLERFSGQAEAVREKGTHGYVDGLSGQPFLLCNGNGFIQGGHVEKKTSLIDIAPTVLRFLNQEIPAHMEGKPIQELI